MADGTDALDQAAELAADVARAERVAGLMNGLTDTQVMANILDQILRLHDRLDAFEALVGQLSELGRKGLPGMLAGFLTPKG